MSDNKKAFVHLHVHSEYSILDGLNKVKPLVARVKNLEMTACAITDHGNLSAAIEFYKACKAADIKPIIGMEAYVTTDEDDLPNEKKTRDNRHMVLLVQNEIGLANLIWLNNRAHLHNFYYHPRVFKGHFQTHSEGLIATSACLGGLMAKKAVVKDNVVLQPGALYDDSTKSFSDPDHTGEKWLSEIAQCFPKRFYLEIQDHPNWEQIAFNRWAKLNHERLGLPLVLTCDAHYAQKEDKAVHDLLMAQQFKMTLAEYKAKDQFEVLNFIREPEELYLFSENFGVQEAFWNTREIAEQCNLELTLGKYETPNFDITKCSDYKDFLASEAKV